MTNAEKLYHEICALKPKTIVNSVSERLDNILKVYIEELEESENDLLTNHSGFSIYKELSKSKWIRR